MRISSNAVLKFFIFCGGMDCSFSVSSSNVSLQGVWSSLHHAVFLWHEAKVIKRHSSDHEGDYWLAYATAACLASSCCYVTARYNPVSQTLNFTRSGNSAVDGPWKLLIGAPQTDENSSSMVFFTSSGIKLLQEKKPELVEKAWGDPTASAELLDLVYGRNEHRSNIFKDRCALLVWRPKSQEEALLDDVLPHGTRYTPSRLLARDEVEQRRDRQGKADNGQLLITT
jgi:hypothetical protein